MKLFWLTWMAQANRDAVRDFDRKGLSGGLTAKQSEAARKAVKSRKAPKTPYREGPHSLN